ncbi:Ulvan-active sulfatase [Chitinophaga sp. MM2321]
MVLTHDPFQATPDSQDFSASKAKDKSSPAYFGSMVAYMDKKVGEIIKTVQEQGISRKTLIIFAGDNGTSPSIISVLDGKEVKGGKGRTTVYGTHVPLIAYWEGVVKPGQVNHNLIDFTDILPTFLETAGKEKPADFHTDGTSFYGQLLNKKNAAKRDWVFCAYDPKWGSFKPATWIQDKQWKLYQTGEFYDLQQDPEEKYAIQTTNLTPREMAGKEKLKQQLLNILQPGR